MAESYRGLTIRIGGDTTKLTKALHTANQAVSGTQSGLKKLSDALKMDPTSLHAAQLQVGAFAEQAANAATRLTTLNEAMRQVGTSMPKGATETVREMASAWGDVNMKASEARDSFNKLTSVLATEYTNLSHISSEAAKAFGDTFSKGWKIDTNIDQIIADIDQLPVAFQKSDKEVQKFLDSFESMQVKYAQLTEAATKYENAIQAGGDQKDVEKNIQQLEDTKKKLDELDTAFAKLVARFTNFDGEVFKFDNDNVNLDSLKRGLDDIVSSGMRTQEWADEMYTKFESMKRAWLDAQTSLNIANTVEGYKDLEAETAKAEARVKSLVDEMLRLAQTSDIAKGLVSLKQELKEIDAAGNSAKTRMQEFLSIISNNNANKQATGEGTQVAAMQAYSDALEAARLKYENLMKQLKAYDGVDEQIVQLANSTQSLVGLSAQANANFEQSATVLKTYEGALETAHKRMQDIKDAHPEDFAGMAEYQNAAREFNLWSEIVEIARGRFNDFNEELQNINKAGEIRKLRGDASEAYEEIKSWEEINFKPEVDVSSIEGFKKAIESINKGIYDSVGSSKNGDPWNFSKIAENIAVANTALDEARNKYTSLTAAFKSDPTNSDTIVQRTQALNQYTEKLNNSIASYRAQIDAIPADKINQTALATGTVSESFARAKLEVDKLDTAIAQTEKQIKTLTDERNRIKAVNPEARAEVAKLDERIKALKESLKELQSQADVALDNLATEDNTRRVDAAQAKIQELIAELHKLGVEVNNAGQIKMPAPQIDEAAFMQVVDRISQGVRQMTQEVVQSANEIDAAFRDMTKTVNGTDAQFEELKNAAVEFSQTHVTSADTMLEMQALGGQLGVLAENLEQFGKIGSNLDIATDMDAEDIALRLGQISNVLQLDIDGMQGFSDALVRLGNNMPAQESSIMAVAQRFAAVASTANFSGEEVLAWSASIAATGQRSEAAATAISNTVSGIEQAIANGGSTLEQFAAISGMSSEEFVNSWKTGPTEALKSFINGLQTLNDSDESAVAALENMGITGVRQQQTLLALSRTIDNLDDALAMSSNAWHQVSDQWGQAGDAAIEADKKSRGFSGALAIMQNNAQNLAASLGDGLIPFMNAASKVMEFMTDVLSNMSPFAKSALVFLAGTTAAFSTLNPMLTVFSKGISGTLAAIKQSTSIVELIANLTGLEGALMGAAEQGVNLVSVFGKFAPMAIGISAVAVAFGVAMNAINEYNEKQELLRQATDGMTEAAQRAREAYESYSVGTSSAITSLEDLRAKTNEVIESQASLADSMGAKWAEVGESAGSVDYFAQKIVELSEQGELTLAQQSELNAAVEAFNDITGSGIEILDKNTGKLSESADAISKTAEAWKQLAISEAAYEMYKDVVKQRIKDQMALDEVTNSMIETQKDWAEWEGKSVDEVDLLTHATKEQREQYETLTASIEYADKTMDQYLHYMTATDQVVTEMREALVKAGGDVELFDSLNKEELAQLVAVWDGSVDEIVKAMSRISDQRRNAAKATSDELDEVSKAAAKARAESYKAEATDEYNARKAELDKIYNDTKRSYDARYNALKKSLDSEYDEKKRQLDRQYDLRKRALDKEYDAQKQAYDKQYDALKRSLDRQYDAQKLKLDHELDAIKKSNDAKLQALKRRFDNEEDAYKDATEHQVKELERKHKLEIRAIEDERDAKVKAIDEEIRALEALNDAEQHEVDKTKQDNKIAELQKKVNDAKSRRKKAEAEKELNEYIQEVEVKRRKWERDAQIEDLKLKKETIKEEADARKDAANDAYDIEKENFKNSREEQLELLKQANDDRYNAMKLALEAEEQAKKEANDLALENIKYNHQDQLQELKDHNDAQLAALKEKNELELQSIKDNNDMILQSMKDAHSAQLDEMKNNQSIALENMKAAHTKELQDLKATQDAEYKAIKNGEDMKTNAQAKGNQERNKAQEQADQKMTESQSRYMYAMEQRMQEMGDKNIGVVEDSGGKMNQSAEQRLSELDKTFGHYGEQVPQSFINPFSRANISHAAEMQASSALSPFLRLPPDMYTSGWDMITQFNNGLVEAWYSGGSLMDSINNVAQYIRDRIGFSVPKYGPMSDADKWGPDMVNLIADGIRSEQSRLIRQVEKMSDAMEEAFDPTLSVDAAFEALDTIGKNRGKSLEVLADSKSAPVVNVTLNMNLSGVSIREDADIERLAKAMSQEMAAQAARQIAGRLG